jgi:hypothetical protein
MSDEVERIFLFDRTPKVTVKQRGFFPRHLKKQKKKGQPKFTSYRLRPRVVRYSRSRLDGIIF